MKFIYKPGVLVAKTKEKFDTGSKLKDETNHGLSEINGPN